MRREVENGLEIGHGQMDSECQSSNDVGSCPPLTPRLYRLTTSVSLSLISIIIITVASNVLSPHSSCSPRTPTSTSQRHRNSLPSPEYSIK
ncbi:hypothetical protein SISNIDRAFT_485501 [Sistotremastrum niveocremeum HHB9708]|uniref:Uncharacterized protein n=1 Tax=Sistotremastrum niveocremeum HHB9708 TaxID=1314777 RepID=A0A164UH54_9AGAM|nr:hypothetical protein SISNIDRAFT_485501 [Sistotremastrum niveocremeum HHB9708]